MIPKKMVVRDINGKKHVYRLPEYKSSFWDGGFLSDTIFYSLVAVLVGVIISAF